MPSEEEDAKMATRDDFEEKEEVRNSNPYLLYKVFNNDSCLLF